MFRLALACTALLLAVVQAASQAAEPIQLRLASGRVLGGEVSPRTSAERLWLVQRSGAAEIARPIAWEAIVAAEFDGRRYASRDLRQRLAGDAPSTPDDAKQNPFADDEQPASARRTRKLFQPISLEAPRMTSVRLDAHLANWDADVEADGLAVQVVPIDAHGRVARLGGTLHVELFGVRRIAFQDGPAKRGRSYDRLGDWTLQLPPDHFGASGGWFKLPFQAAQPEFDSRIGYLGLVHVKLIVPGAGVFEDSLDGVRLRPLAPLRDALELDMGRRFFPTETTGRGQRTW